MPKFYATFGMGQYGGAFKNSYITINAETYSGARTLMVEAFGNIWSFIYSEDEFKKQIPLYGLKEIGILDLE